MERIDEMYSRENEFVDDSTRIKEKIDPRLLAWILGWGGGGGWCQLFSQVWWLGPAPPPSEYSHENC